MRFSLVSSQCELATIGYICCDLMDTVSYLLCFFFYLEVLVSYLESFLYAYLVEFKNSRYHFDILADSYDYC